MSFIENPLERTKLRDNNEYPLSPAYRTEITGTGAHEEMDYSFAYNSESDTPSTYIQFSSPVLGPDPVNYYLYPVDTTALTVGELGRSSVDFNVGDIHYNITDTCVTNFNNLLAMFVSSMGATPQDSFTLFGDNVARIAAFAGGDSKTLSVVSIPSSISPQIVEQIDIKAIYGGQEIDTTLTVTLSVADAGTYVLVTGYTDSYLSLTGLTGTIRVCDWHLDPCYLNSGLVGVNNGVFLELLKAMGANGVQLLSCPTIQNKLMFARHNLCGLVLGGWMGENGFTDGTFDGWTFSNGMTLEITLVDGVPTVATLILPSQSQEES